MNPSRVGETQLRILEELKRRGRASVPELAGVLEMSVETIRTHLKALGAEGLVERRGQRRDGPGRPEIVWGTTRAADRHFPGRERELLRGLTTWLESEGRGEWVREFFELQAEERRRAVAERVEGLEGEARIEEVARILTEEGFMAELLTTDAGETRLRLCNCPIRSLVDVSEAPCRAELRFVRELLGSDLERVSYIPAGHDACCYTARPQG